RNGFHDVFVSASIESAHNGSDVFSSCIEEHGSGLACRTHLLEYLKAVTVSQLEVENNAVVLVHERKQAGVLARMRDVYCVPVFREDAANETGDRLVVFCDENANGTHLRWKEALLSRTEFLPHPQQLFSGFCEED